MHKIFEFVKSKSNALKSLATVRNIPYVLGVTSCSENNLYAQTHPKIEWVIGNCFTRVSSTSISLIYKLNSMG